MNIAFTFDFNRPTPFVREGLSIFIKNLASAMIEYDKTLEMELWSYRMNASELKNLFSEIINKYPSNVKSFDEYSVFSFTLFVKPLLPLLMRNPLNILRIIKHSILFILYKRLESKERIVSLLFPVGTNSKVLKVLKRIVRKCSKSDLVFPVSPMLSLALSFNCRKILQIHDLFYLANRDIFVQQEPDIDNINIQLSETLNNYANTDTIFVSSTNYIRDNHVLKYIPSIKIEQTRIIHYPPMLKEPDLYTLPEQNSFLKKYNLPERYIAFPSQNRPNKNIIAILHALLILRKKSIIVKFVTTGSLHHFLPVLEFIEKNDLKEQVIEIGSLSEEDLIALYKFSTLVVCPNIIEGPGMPQQCLEALTVGNIPVIHARSLGIKESLEDVGLTFETADLNWFDFDDYSGLAVRIEDALNNPNPHIEKQKHILSHYTKITWEDTAKKYLELANI
jgi:glycosyltransferase involved in cell wall biosynthesis